MEASFFKTLEKQRVRCTLCHQNCQIPDGKRGLCGVRRNQGGRLETLVYGRLVARHVDPIEKKPIFHMLPGSQSYSVATVGCNFKCRFCQNADIAQMPNDYHGTITGRICAPEDVVADAIARGCRSIAYTYTEPTIFFEFAYDTAEIASANGLKNIFVTNGYIGAEALDKLAPFLDAANVDLKAYSDDFYKRQCGARLEPVRETLRRMKALGVLVEVTTLVIPGLNDDPEELKALADFLVEQLGPETPWHVSRFHPTYHLMDRPTTPAQTLKRAAEIGRSAGLHYVYLGNLPGEDSESTYCPQCRALLIKRWGFSVRGNRIDNGCCPDCRNPIYGIGLSSSGASGP